MNPVSGEKVFRLPQTLSCKGKRVLFAAFDAYPGLKGAATHIRANLRAVAAQGGEATLLCLGPGGSFRDPDSGAQVHACGAVEGNLLRRSELFGRFLTETAHTVRADPPQIIHFRDIWSGMPLLSHPLADRCPLVFEVNGLPSVELPSHYPRLAGNGSLLARLRQMEDGCLARADRVITVSRRTSRYLADRGCDPGKIVVIPNAADPVPCSAELPEAAAGFEQAGSAGRKIILYAGTPAPWQGLPTLLQAVALLDRRRDFSLVVAAPARKGVGRLRRQVASRWPGGRVTILEGVPCGAMPSLYARSYLSLAPLTRGARNEIQGCCPLKIVESMAAAAPVLASDLPVVRELVSPGEDGWLATPDSSRALAAALDMLLDNEALRNRLALGARERARRDFATQLFAERLNAVYTGVTGGL